MDRVKYSGGHVVGAADSVPIMTVPLLLMLQREKEPSDSIIQKEDPRQGMMCSTVGSVAASR